MNFTNWIANHQGQFGSDYEVLFAETVLPWVPELHFEAITVQYPFKDLDRNQRYCDFVIQEGDAVRIAIEIDGYDKRGTGMGMSHADFIDWQRRQAALTSQGWYVLRFANRDVRDEPQRCAEHISLLLKRSRAKLQNRGLSDEDKQRLDELNQKQNSQFEQLSLQTVSTQKAVKAIAALVLLLALAVVWQSGVFSSKPAPLVTQEAASTKAHQPALLVPEQAPPQPPPTTPAKLPAKPDKRPPPEQPPQTYPQQQAMPLGASCDNPISWQTVGQHIGNTVSVHGPVMAVTQKEGIRGNPTWIEVGAAYPTPSRLKVVIWIEDKPRFPMVLPGLLDGKNVCITGLVTDYKGVAQIVMRDAGQLSLLQ